MKAPERIQEIFAQALERKSPAEREKYLAEACQGEPELRREIESLLRAGEQAGDFLRPTIQVTESDFVSEKAGARIGRYKLLEQIGEGGFGVVWMAEQEEPVRRRVALKIIKLGMDTKEVVARFEAERQALAMMDHPNIAIVFDGGATDTGRPYFVMELVKGIPITDYCDASKLSTRARLELFRQVCQAVQHAHQKGVIHRDLKPSNILVTVKDDRPVPKVIDFGIAKATQARLTEKTVFTRFHQWIGTPAYMSPEQAGLGNLDVDTRSDIYSLGVLLYELLTGRTPFDPQKLLAAGYDAVMRTIREEEPPKPSTRLTTLAEAELSAVAAKRGVEPAKLGRSVRGDLDWIVMKALEKDRARRYDTAASLAQDVERHLHAEPVSAAAPDFLYRAGKFVRRNRTRLAFAGLALTVVTLAAVGGKFALSSRSAQQAFQSASTNTVFNLAKSGDAKTLARLLDANPLLLNQRDAEGATPLIYAAGAGNTNTLPLLLARGAAVDATNRTGWTALGNAAGNNRTAAALMLIAAGADPNHAESSGVTPLQAAACFGSVEIGRALLAKGARTDALSRPAMLSALAQAAIAGHADFVDLLLSSGAGVETRDASGQTPLHFAAMGQNTTGIVRLWKEKLGTLTRRGTGDESLAQAVQEISNRTARLETTLPVGSLLGGGEHSRVAEALLAHGAALEATNRAGRTPLWMAAQFTNESVAQVLIAHKANLNARDADGLSPLHVAVVRKARGMVTRLLDAGADPNRQDWAGFTPLHSAVEHDRRDLAEVLLLHHADPNLACPSVAGSVFMGQSPLDTAAVHGNLDLIRLLLDNGASIFPTAGMDSPLVWAVKGGHPRAVELLLSRGAQANLNNPRDGKTALHWAALLGQVESATLLLDHGASNNVLSQAGTPLHFAVVGREGAEQFLARIMNPGSTNATVHELPRGTDRDYAATVKLLLVRGADVEARDQAFQRTPLFSAIWAGNLPAVETLLAAGAKLDARDSVGTTPLHAASESRASSEMVSNIVVRLLQAGAAPDARDDRRATPLHAAAIGGRTEVVALLIAAGATVNAQGPFFATPLHCAVQQGNRPLVELLLAKRADLERRNSTGNTALHLAVFLKSKELVTLLLDHDADVNAAQPNGTTPIALAAELGDAEVFHLLRDRRAKLDLIYPSGGTLLHAAAAGGSVEIVKFLLDDGAKSDQGDREGNTALMTAAKSGRLVVVKFFLENGAPLEEHDSEGFTVLHGAADHGHAELVEFLLGRGLDVNSRSTTQYTPLHCAANGFFTNEVHYLAVIKVLLAHGADVNARMQGNQTPLHRAAEWGRPRILQALLAAGGDPNAPNDDGKTALDIAKVSDDPRLRADVAARRKECEKLLRSNRQNPTGGGVIPTTLQNTNSHAQMEPDDDKAQAVLRNRLSPDAAGGRVYFPAGIVAVVNERPILDSEVREKVSRAEELLRRQYPNDAALLERKLREQQQEALEDLINDELILSEAEKAGRRLSEEHLDEYIKSLIQTNYDGDSNSLVKALAAQGRTVDEFRERHRQRDLVLAARQEKIGSPPPPTPERIEQYYHAHEQDFRANEEVKLAMIVLNKDPTNDLAAVESQRKDAAAIHARLVAGADFATEAKLHSQGRSAQQGGDWGWVECSLLRKELAGVAFSLKPGGPSDVIETKEAWFIMKVADRRPGALKPMAEVRADLVKILQTQDRTAVVKHWLEGLRAKALVRYFGGVAANSVSSQKRVLEIQVKHVGPSSVGDSLIRLRLRVKEGDPVTQASVDHDIRSLYGTGDFDNIRVAAADSDGGITLTYAIQERPMLDDIRFTGNKALSSAELLRKLTSKTGERMDEWKLFNDALTIQSLYQKAGFPKARVKSVPAINEQAGRGSVTFEVTEGTQ